MGEQNHRIKRQIVELRVTEVERAESLQSRISRLQQQYIIPLFERICDHLSAPDRIHRIDSLQLDLGSIEIDRFEQKFVARLERVLPGALAEQISQEERKADNRGDSSRISSQLELLALFARTGSLPWWADLDQPDVLEQSMRILMSNAPRALARLMRELVQEERALRRLVLHYDDALLAELLGLLAHSSGSPSSSLPEQLTIRLQKSEAAAGISRAHLRNVLWQSILSAALQIEARQSDATALCRDVLFSVAISLSTPYHSLISSLHRSLDERGAGWLDSVITGLYREIWHDSGQDLTSPALAVRSTPEHPSTAEELAAIRAGLEQAKSPLAPLVGALYSVATRLSDPVQAEWLALLSDFARVGATGSSASDVGRWLRGYLEKALTSRLVSPAHWAKIAEIMEQCLVDMPSDIAAGLSPRHQAEVDRVFREAINRARQAVDQPHRARARQAALPAKYAEPRRQARQPELPRTTSFSDSDELYINNSGLIILWPFLDRFFGRLDLVADKRFVDQSAQMRAVAVLQYVVDDRITDRSAAPEYLLDLNKVLCGMDVSEVFDPGLPISETEAEECARLLGAVIEHAPILNNMSISGFRGTFLARKGILSSRDGAWLLRVQRETYDIVLDRFPWTFRWINLPWMQVPLVVEW
ncbi:MAG: hypothetical protein MJE77_28680 [Proteobacteria bacterium]|nr:hypothetical protein [Pseudomonadota bacterium]